jgi:predicted transcriptional regulator
MLVRLIDKGFITSTREGRERSFTPVVSEEEYLQLETTDFMRRYQGNSVGSLVKALCDTAEVADEELADLRAWFTQRSTRRDEVR